MICRPLLEYGHTIFQNTSESTLKNLEVAERTCLRKITKIRHPNNPLHNPPNQLLYEATEIEPILSRLREQSKKFIKGITNKTIITPLLHQYDTESPPKAKLPALPIYEHLISLE
ncbi:uncharacterized protein LOC123320825 [Coccinella septempunctata]|uniref:uncharacterized protein LOC123320825 n=1 Tax=Coccinella septempunctata TaxID=41139 RepID=UPI001D094C98|nr:uncharacterized protein LOC123320825 [Coccinella septempunctata]